MPHIPVVPPEEASDKVKAVYNEFYQRMSFPALKLLSILGC